MTDQSGIHVIAWAQTELDGVPRAPFDALMIGTIWRWSGEAVAVADAAAQPASADPAQQRRRGARFVRRLLAAAVTGRDIATMRDDPRLPQPCFILTDGHRTFVATVIEAEGSVARLVMFAGAPPPADTDLWVIHLMTEAANPEASAAGVICFTPGTRIAVPGGVRAIEDIVPGDLVRTKDNGAQQVLWTGRRRLSGERLAVMPHLRPIRIRAGAIGGGRPEGDLIVSPGHRMLIAGSASAALYCAPEVLIAARDLVDGHGVVVERAPPDVTYIHLMTERHEVIWANGMETESFHPANAAIDLIEPSERAALFALRPEVEDDPANYGAFVRPNLTPAEAASLRSGAA